MVTVKRAAAAADDDEVMQVKNRALADRITYSSAASVAGRVAYEIGGRMARYGCSRFYTCIVLSRSQKRNTLSSWRQNVSCQ